MATCIHPRLIQSNISLTPDSVYFRDERLVRDNIVSVPLVVPCGKCRSCLTNKAREKAAKFLLEAHSQPYRTFFVTYTFEGTPPPAQCLPSDIRFSHIPLNGECKFKHPAYYEIQKLHKRMRKDGFVFKHLTLQEFSDVDPSNKSRHSDGGRLHFHTLYLFENVEHVFDFEGLNDKKLSPKVRKAFRHPEKGIYAKVKTHLKLSGLSLLRDPSDIEVRMRKYVGFRAWRKGVTQVYEPDQIDGAVTSYVTMYATTYAYDKNDDPFMRPRWYSSRLGSNWFHSHKTSIADGSLRSMPCGSDKYRIPLPRYWIRKFRNPYDVLEDFKSKYVKNITERLKTASQWCKELCLFIKPTLTESDCIDIFNKAMSTPLTVGSQNDIDLCSWLTFPRRLVSGIVPEYDWFGYYYNDYLKLSHQII